LRDTQEENKLPLNDIQNKAFSKELKQASLKNDRL